MPDMAKRWSCLWALLVLLWPVLVFADVAARAVFVTGSPVVTASSGASRPLLRGGELAPGDSINTADGRVQLRFSDGASLSLQPGTQFRIDAFRFTDRGNRASPGDGVVMTLIKGALRTVTGLLGKEDYNQYKLGTTVATIGVRGTEYGASFDGSGLAVTTYAGRVEVCSDVACQQIGPGETVWVYERNERPQMMPRASVLHGADVQPGLPQMPATANLPAQASPSMLPSAGPASISPQATPMSTQTASPMSATQTPSTGPSIK